MAFSRGACRACSLAKLAVTGRVSVAFGLDATLSHFYDSPPHRHSTNPSINTWKALSRSMASGRGSRCVKERHHGGCCCLPCEHRNLLPPPRPLPPLSSLPRLICSSSLLTTTLTRPALSSLPQLCTPSFPLPSASILLNPPLLPSGPPLFLPPFLSILFPLPLPVFTVWW